MPKNAEKRRKLILELLSEQPDGIWANKLADLSKMSRGNFYYHLNKLLAAKEIKKEVVTMSGMKTSLIRYKLI